MIKHSDDAIKAWENLILGENVSAESGLEIAALFLFPCDNLSLILCLTNHKQED